MSIEIQNTSTEVVAGVDVEIKPSNVDANVCQSTDLSVEVNKREYSIVGDNLYIPKRYSDAPAWMRTLIDQTVAAGIAAAKGDLKSVTDSLNTLLLELEIAKNTYTQSIISSNDIDKRINTAITTLNSSLAASDATILNIAQTAVTPDEAQALVIAGISAELAKTDVGTLGATIANLQQALVDGDSANATSIDVLASTIEGEVDARASAITTINTYVGIDETGTPTGTGLLASIDSLQNQIDGNITTWFYYGEPTLLNAPAVDWSTDTEKANHVGDIYYDKLSGYGYRFAYEDIDDNPDMGIIYSWIRIVDTDVVKALADAANAQATADGKITTFYQSTNPTAEGVGDLWIDSDNNNKLHRWNGSIWEYVRDTTKDSEIVAAIADALAAAQNAQDTADGKIESFYQATAPVVASEGDIWFDTDGGNRIHTYRSGVWVDSQDSQIGQALLDAADAKSTADGKIVTFYQPTNPIAEGIGDLWIDSDNNNKVHRWNGSIWEYVRDTTKDSEIVAALAAAQNAQDTADGKIVSFYQISAPTLASEGDIWFDTDDGNRIHTYRSGVWVDSQDSKIGQALLDAANAQATADGKIVTFYQANAPIAEGIGDIWIDSDNGNKMYRWNGTSWGSDLVGTMVANASAVTALSTELSNGTNTWAAADSTVTSSLTTLISDGDAFVTSKWAYNSLLSINGVYYNSGFGINTSVTTSGNGTEGSPYSSEFWIDASRLKFTNSAKTGSTAPFTIDASGTTPQITFNGKVSFSNVTGAPGGSGNLLYNSAPSLGNEQKGWQIGWYNTNIVPVLGSGSDPWRPSGGGSVYAVVPGAPTVGTAFDVLQTNRVPVVGGSWYDASAYISSHRCTSYVTIAWFDSNDTYISEVGGSQISGAFSGALVNWGRSVLFAQAPANAAKASFYVRSIVNGTDPYCFVAFAYLGKSVVGQTVHSDWSEGTSAGVSSGEVVNDINNGNTTTINGGRITTGSITADKINTNNLVAENIRSTSVIQGNTIMGANIQGASIVGAVIKASYLDLDGDLEVLTDYRISTAMYNSNPAFYTDAVFISGTNEYRLPTLSTISTTTETYSITTPNSETVNYSTVEAYSNSAFRNKVYTSPIYSYNVSNVGSNMKFRRIRPYVTLAATDIYSASLLTWYKLQDGDSSNNTHAAAYQDMYFYIGDTLILRLYGGSRGTVGVGTIGQIYVSGSFGTTALWNGSMWNNSVTHTVTSYGLTFTIVVSSQTVYYTPIGGVTVTLNEVPTMTQLPFDVVNGNIRIINGDNTFLRTCTVKTPQIVCNNML